VSPDAFGTVTELPVDAKILVLEPVPPFESNESAENPTGIEYFTITTPCAPALPVVDPSFVPPVYLVSPPDPYVCKPADHAAYVPGFA
jgi:hypothetical protein